MNEYLKLKNYYNQFLHRHSVLVFLFVLHLVQVAGAGGSYIWFKANLADSHI